MSGRPSQPGRRRRAEVERRPPPPIEAPSRRSFGLGFWATLLAGAWIGRASVALPESLGTLFDLFLPLAAGLFVFLTYRRFIRTRLEASRAAARQQQARRAASHDETT
ncbi:MAG: hypothetical protein K1X87_09795 [Dehalococcoidia bacterium]|mgnify:CR=1 FL=1|nr:hypothetical protein [Dehalococcoidia bacterium]